MKTNEKKKNFLLYNSLNSTPRLAHLLSPSLAHRYHAIPVAKEGDTITVAMANPQDLKAKAAINQALGSQTFVVQANVDAIDKLIEEFWHEKDEQRPHILVWMPTNSENDEVEAYAQSLANLLDAELSLSETRETGRQLLNTLIKKVEQTRTDIVITKPSEKYSISKLIRGPHLKKIIKSLPSSLLITPQPQWPIKKILFIIQDTVSDDPAFNWTLQIAKRSGASVTVLVVTPPMEALYNPELTLRYVLPLLHSSDCTLGQKTRRFLSRFVDFEITATLKLRSESSWLQIKNELIEDNFDLVVLGAESQKRVVRWMQSDLITPLVNWTDIPVLIAKPGPSHEGNYQ